MWTLVIAKRRPNDCCCHATYPQYWIVEGQEDGQRVFVLEYAELGLAWVVGRGNDNIYTAMDVAEALILHREEGWELTPQDVYGMYHPPRPAER